MSICSLAPSVRYEDAFWPATERSDVFSSKLGFTEW